MKSETQTLAAVLRRAAAELQAQQPPAALRARVQASFQAALREAPPPHLRRRRGLWAWSGAAACATVLAGSAVLMLRLPPPASVTVDDGQRYGAFVRVAPPERWPTGGNAPAWLVRTELQGERLAALGLPYDPAHAGDSVPAELLLHPSGEVLAVRFVR